MQNSNTLTLFHIKGKNLGNVSVFTYVADVCVCVPFFSFLEKWSFDLELTAHSFHNRMTFCSKSQQKTHSCLCLNEYMCTLAC